MSEKTMMMFKMVLRGDELQRITVEGDNSIAVDLHGLGTKDSLVFVNNIINLNRSECELKVIHGFNHGTALKDMINGRFVNPRIIKRSPVEGNPGVTVLECSAAN